ncbi:MAG: hypothetical protein IPI65_17045 [Bacteroidetes bacterium]|nr:hypothetical protein [Bacteroidota bacterium]
MQKWSRNINSFKKKYDHVDVIMISGQDKIDVAVECVREGAFDYVVKVLQHLCTEQAFEKLFKHRQVIHELAKYKN